MFARIVVIWISDEPDPLLIRSLVHPVISTFMFVLVLWLNATAVFGMIVSLACRRNLFGPSGRIAAYTSGWLVPWMILLVVVPVSLFEWLGDNALMGKFGHVWIVAWLSCHALMLVVYVSINARSVAHIRYVNFDDGTITPIAGERPSA